MTAKVLVLGARGAVGQAVIAALVERGVPVRAASRRASDESAGGAVENVYFDLERPDTFAPALAGVDRVFLIARPGDDCPEALAIPLIEAMRRASVRHVVHLSAMGVEQRPEFGLRKVEVALECSGMAWTHLRPNFFFQIFSTGALLAGIRAYGEIRLPAADAKLSFLDAGDVGAVAAAALTEGGHEGRAYTLTGGEALDHQSIAATLAAVTARPISYVALDEEQARSELSRAGFPPAWVQRLIGFYRIVRAGAGAHVTTSVQEVLGRPPVRFADFARQHAALW